MYWRGGGGEAGGGGLAGPPLLLWFPQPWRQRRRKFFLKILLRERHGRKLCLEQWKGRRGERVQVGVPPSSCGVRPF